MKDSERIMEGLDSMYHKLLAFKKYKGTPLVVSRHGKVVELKAKDLASTDRVYQSPSGKNL